MLLIKKKCTFVIYKKINCLTFYLKIFMLKNKIEKKAPLDYKEPYEFRLLIGDNIICQRYFKINNFNPLSLTSMELTDVIRSCAKMIDEDLKSKSRVYTWYMAPLVFDSEGEMYEWFSKPENTKDIRICENISIRDRGDKDFIWNGEKIVEPEKKFEDFPFSTSLEEKDELTYEFAFYVNDKKVVSTIFNGVYPYFIRRNIDLSNSKGRFDGEDTSRLSFENYILNCLVRERPDLIKKIVKEICYVCSGDGIVYTQNEIFKSKNGKKIEYPLDVLNPKHLQKTFAKEIAKAKKYLNSK